MTERIVVTSMGVLSALGIGSAAQIQALRSSRSGLRHPVYLNTVHTDEFVLGEVDFSNDALSEMLGLPAGDNGYTRTTLLALIAMQDLLKTIDIELLHSEPLAFINAGTVGGMCTIEDIYMNFIAADTDERNTKYIDSFDCAESTLAISAYYNIRPLMATISTACSSSANALLLGARMIKNGVVKRAICGGCDALSKFTLNGFNTLKNVDKRPCRPFDQNRFGLNLGEGAGYLLLETEAAAKERGAEILAVFSGYCNTNEAFHPTAPSPNGDGAYATMLGALQMAGVNAEDVDYINAHGTATQNNDQSEGRAMQRLFDKKMPYFSSTKPFTGHTLAAAGAIEAIFSILAMSEKMILPNLNFDTPMEELTIQPTTKLIENVTLKHVLSNSFGFGGNNASLLFSQS